MDPDVKDAAWRRCDGECEQCGRSVSRSDWTGHVHHITYENEGDERLEDVLVLCLRCHNQEHPHHDFVSKEDQKRRQARNAARRERNRERKHNDPDWDERWGYQIRDARRALDNKRSEIEGR